MNPGHYSSLLPDVFKNKSSRVRVFQPQVILLDFHGTISERRWEDKIIFPYVRKAVGTFLRENWTNETVQRCLPGLKNESFEQRFRHRYEDAPIIEDQAPSSDADDTEPLRLIDQMGDFLLWQMNTKHETRETEIIERLVWQDGFRRKQILTPLYEDVMSSVKCWREQHSCAIYVISSIDGDTLKLLFENTDKGNLGQYISGYVSSKKIGDKLISETYKQFYEKLNLKASQPEEKSKGRCKSPSGRHQNGLKSPPSTLSSGRSSSGSLRSPKSPPSNESLAKPVLFLTDSGQEAKSASQVANGSAFECLLLNRPGNKRIRTYYLSQFQYVDRFDNIEFV